MNPFSTHTVFKSDSTGFTLLELVVVISIMMILLVFSMAPYNYYADKARVRLSVERVEQMMNKAKLLAGTWYSSGTTNVDLVIRLKKWSSEVSLSSVPANSSPVSLTSSERRQIEKFSLESKVLISQIGGARGAENVDIVYRSPMGNSDIWESSNDTSAPVVSTISTTYTGGILGLDGKEQGTLSKPFRIIR